MKSRVAQVETCHGCGSCYRPYIHYTPYLHERSQWLGCLDFAALVFEIYLRFMGCVLGFHDLRRIKWNTEHRMLKFWGGEPKGLALITNYYSTNYFLQGLDPVTPSGMKSEEHLNI